MKETLTTLEVAHKLYTDDNAGWSWAGAQALAEYFEQYEEDTGEEMEFDRVAIRCDYSEYASALEAYAELSNDELEGDTDEDKEKQALAYLQDNTTVIEFDGGIIVGNFY